jgi:hypothetical protein
VVAVTIALIGAIATIVAAVIQTSGSSSNSNNPSASPSNSSHLLIESVSFSNDSGKVILVVSGIYHQQAGDGYLYAVARSSKVPYGTAYWLVSEPVTPNQNGRWTADITLTTAESHHKMTVFAVLAGGCPPPNSCGPSPEAVRQGIELGGPKSADYSTPSRVTASAAAAITSPSPLVTGTILMPEGYVYNRPSLRSSVVAFVHYGETVLIRCTT